MNPSDRAASYDPAVPFTTAAAGLVGSTDTLGIVTQLLLDAVSALSAGGAGLITVQPGGKPDLLSATSHRTEELELFQLQSDSGPCVDAISTGKTVSAPTMTDVAERWPSLVAAARNAGYAALYAAPMRWQEHTLGALNLFWTAAHDASDQAVLIQGYADIATIALIHGGHLSVDEVSDRTRRALTSRHAIEQAKGVLAFQESLSMEAAYERLLQLASADGLGLSAAATKIIEQAHRPPVA